MFAVVLSLFLTALPDQEGREKNEAQLLIDTIETLLQPVEDFRCEFEGTMRVRGKVAQSFKVEREDGLYESFSGAFIWRRGGDIHNESLNRRAADGRIMRNTLVVRMREQQAEYYQRLNDAPIGLAYVRSAKEVTTRNYDCLGAIFLIDGLKQGVSDRSMEASVGDDRIDGHSLKVLKFALKGNTDIVVSRFWIDLRRNGHVVRVENQGPEMSLWFVSISS